MAYDPTQDYNNAYNSVQNRIRMNYARERGATQGDIAARGVATSGVASIPGEQINREEAGALNDAAGNFALEQARTGIEDRRRAEDFAHQKELAMLGFNAESALQRRLGQNQMLGSLGAGAISAAGAYLGRH